MKKHTMVKLLAGISIAFAIVAALAVGTTTAATTTASLGISASVAAKCSVSTTAVAFGAYDPLGTEATTPKDANGAVIVTCTKGWQNRIDLDLGANSPGPGVRRMLGSVAGNYLTYELYSDSAGGTVWGSGAGNGFTPAAPAPDKNPQTFTVYGRVPAAQDVAAGSYSDTITATVNY